MKIIISVIVLIFLFFLLAVIMRILGHLILIITFNKRLDRKKNSHIIKLSAFENMTSEELKVSSDGSMLYGQLYYISGIQYRGIVIIVPGHKVFCDDYLNEINFFACHNYMVYAYDTTGCGGSEGKFPKGHPRWFLDLNNVINFFEKDIKFNHYKLYLFGHSMGGYAVTSVLNFTHHKVVAAAACSSVNSGFDFGFITWKNHKNFIMKQLYLGMKKHEYKRFGEYALYTAVGGINKTNVPVMIFHGRDDKTVPLKYSLFSYRECISNPEAVFKLVDTKSHYVFKENIEHEFLSAFSTNFQQPYEYKINENIMNLILDFYEKY